MSFSKKNNKVGLLIWNSSDNSWKGWHGFVGVFKNRGKALDRISSEKRRHSNIAHIIDYQTLKVLSVHEKKNGQWQRVKVV